MFRKIIALLLASFLIFTLLGCSAKSSETSTKNSEKRTTQESAYENNFYITPGYGETNNYQGDYENLMDLKKRLGTGGKYAKIGWQTSVWYMNETKGRAHDYEFDPAALKRVFKLVKATKLPIVIVLNGGAWSDAVFSGSETNLIDYLEEDDANVQWKDDGTVPADSEGAMPGLYRSLTYNNLNQVVRKYQKRNLQAAVKEIVKFRKENPDLFIALTIEPEIFLSPFYYADYNPQTIEEFQSYEKKKFDDSLADFNKAMKTNFTSWSKVDPPRPSENKGDAAPGKKFWEEWTDFRINLVDQYVQGEIDWVRETGLPADRIYTHQTVRYDNRDWTRYMLASTMKTAQVKGGSLGITTLQDLCFDEELLADTKEADSNWGNFEFNPATSEKKDYKRFYDALQLQYDYGAHIIAPYMWSQEGNEIFYNVRDSEFEKAIKDFVKDVANKPLR